MNTKIKTLLTLGATVACLQSVQAQTQGNSLKSAYQKDFLIGTALGTEHILERNEKANQLIKKEFNAITPENIMKSQLIHPEVNKYNFSLSDKFVDYGLKNQMYIVGHTLVWHSQLPSFVHKISSADSLRIFMKEHIKTVMGRYAGKINSWDVVNEALNEDGTYRKSVFFNKLGDSYIKEAFELAAQVDPKAELYYNDYNIEQPAKRKGAIALIKKLQENGVKIWDEWADADGNLGPVYGHQWRNWNSEEIDQISDLITELKTNPNSRRMLVSAWNPSVLPDTKKSFQENVANNKAALPPCHAFFQFYVADGKLSCQLYQRSADIFLGVPFNIASYALLTMMIAQVCDLGVGEFIHTFGDAHIYNNHFEQIELQLSRETRPLPKMILNPTIKNIFDFDFDDFTLEGYDPHPLIRGSVAV